MPCDHVVTTGGRLTAIVCTRGRKPPRCGWCASPGTFLCDWKLAGGKTCDKPICAAHAREVAPNMHLCAEHLFSFQRKLAELKRWVREGS